MAKLCYITFTALDLKRQPKCIIPLTLLPSCCRVNTVHANCTAPLNLVSSPNKKEIRVREWCSGGLAASIGYIKNTANNTLEYKL